MIKLLLLKLSQFTVCNEIVNIPVVMIDFQYIARGLLRGQPFLYEGIGGGVVKKEIFQTDLGQPNNLFLHRVESLILKNKENICHSGTFGKKIWAQT